MGFTAGGKWRQCAAGMMMGAGALLGAAEAVASPPSWQTSFEPGQPQPSKAWTTGDDALRVTPADGPPAAVVLTAKPGVGFDGVHSLHYQGTSTPQARRLALFDVDLPVQADTELSYVIFPRRSTDGLANPATYTAIDLQFDDGSWLSQRGALDQYRSGAGAREQGAGRVLYPDQWNRVRVALGKVAAGRQIRQVALSHDDPDAPGGFEGWLDSLSIGASALDDASARPSDQVDTRRGSNANGHFSRGNNFPAVAWPHGFNFWTPTTNAGSNWIYQYQERNGADNRPRLEALSLSHEPSPWMGDRQTFQLMPQARANGAPVLERGARALGFSHSAEVAKPYYYKVDLDGGIRAEITPTDHAAMFRFHFAGDRGQLVFDNRDDLGGLVLDAAKAELSGWSDSKSHLSTGATRLFFYAHFDQPVAESGRLTGQGRDHVAGWFGFDTRRQHELNMRIATSLISVEQARHNLALEIAPTDRFDDLRARAQAAWDQRLGKVTVAGASQDERHTLYGNLYRLFLYPNEAYENVGSAASPHYQYASPFAPPVAANTSEHTGAALRDGRLYVNNGLWDTYRTAWPAYSLLTPHEAGEMIDGFVQQYRDSGWIARWSSPGYADLMVGTSADVAFADAWLKGVHNFDVASFYQAALKDASVVSPIAGTGRKGLQRSIFRGYTDSSVDEGLSWSMDGYINDFAIGELAKSLAVTAPPGDGYRHYAEDARYFGNRALDYVQLFQPGSQFFVGRTADGAWRYSATQFDPLRWGGDYTETDGWNMAFHAPQDGAGLAGLYGGRDKLAAKLDGLFATPGQFHVGDYGGVIHEMLEARDVRMGQYGHSNQPSHHLIYMYDYAGQPWKTQDKLRDAMRRLYAGGEIGQGYPGDEDNGEMSAWWLFGAAGFYPLRMGTPTYAIGAPHFPHMTIQLENGRSIQINAPGVSDRNRYVQALRVNGHPWSSLSLPHELLAAGAVLDFTMGPQPSRWGSGEADSPPSITALGQLPRPQVNLGSLMHGAVAVSPAQRGGEALFDQDSSTETQFGSTAPTVAIAYPRAAEVAMYSLTSGQASGDPSSWTVEGSNDGQHWRQLDHRQGERFSWRRQTRAFVVAAPAVYRRYRLRFTSGGFSLAEVEWLGRLAGNGAH